MDAILRMPYVRPHVERYAGHVMALAAPRGSGLGAGSGRGAGAGVSEPQQLAALGLAHLVNDSARYVQSITACMRVYELMVHGSVPSACISAVVQGLAVVIRLYAFPMCLHHCACPLSLGGGSMCRMRANNGSI